MDSLNILINPLFNKASFFSFVHSCLDFAIVINMATKYCTHSHIREQWNLIFLSNWACYFCDPGSVWQNI